MRSFLFVPGDSPRKFEKASAGEADALILDLEDAVAVDRKEKARRETAAMLAAPRGAQRRWVRVNALDTGLTLGDLAATVPGRPDGIALPKCADAKQLRQLSFWLDAFEAAHGIEAGATRIIAIATETAGSLFNLGSYAGVGPRLWGMMWGAEDLSASIGALASRAEGRWTDPFRMARNLCLAGAAAAGVVAIDTIHADIEDLAGLEADAREARRDGFGAKAVIHPKHVPVVNAAFTPDAAELDWARRVVAAFAAPGAGALRMDGKMLDRPHLRLAERLLAAAGG
ncbi:HpcH/HpaI aldolase/citrate lyase family protein [Sabulicella glaciei]|uniref:CoA ester lyase n=1 Tax=Sabulicella glaciei TaxID=2984948 RepID=A0ABT3NU89_9PROT|nr:CoA ester lyase [Roseococcus sp. MDT2-1-1]MCW8085448.1 CoA ester lyase [Roseococcus sp. MDT2-1-1]